MAIAAYAFLIGYLFLYPGILTAANGTAVVNDFLSFWVAAREAVSGNPETPYHSKEFAALQAKYLGEGRFFAFFYPPTYLLLVLPLGFLSGVVAFFAFQILGALAAGLACSRIIGSWHGFLVAAALPASFNTYFHGQNGLWAAALLGGGLVMLAEGRMVLAGVFIGLLTFKPQLGVLIPIALIAGGYWRTFFAAAATSLVFAFVSWLVLGTEVWVAFADQTGFARDTMLHGYVELHKMISVYASLRGLGVPMEVAYGLQGLTLLAGGLLVWKVWNSDTSFEAKAIVLVGAGLLATPFALSYDLALLAVPFAFLIHYGANRPLPAWTALLTAAVVLLTAVSRFAGELGLPFVGPILLAITIWIGWQCRSPNVTPVHG